MLERDGFYKALLDNLSDGVYAVDKQGGITYWNSGAERLAGYTSEEVIGKKSSDDLLMHLDEEGSQFSAAKSIMVPTLRRGAVQEAEVYLQHKQGHRLPVSIRIAPIRDAEGNIVGAVHVFSDNSARMVSQKRIQQLEEMALLCPLTEVGNRRAAELKLQGELNEFHRYGWPFGVLYIDVDRFKNVNDTYGHDTGDEVLRMVAKTVANSLRGFDFLARWGGEEFLGIIANVDKESLTTVANRCRFLVENSKLVKESVKIGVTISIGATLAEPGDSAQTLVKRADRLLYQSKADGRNRVTVAQRL